MKNISPLAGFRNFMLRYVSDIDAKLFSTWGIEFGERQIT